MTQNIEWMPDVAMNFHLWYLRIHVKCRSTRSLQSMVKQSQSKIESPTQRVFNPADLRVYSVGRWQSRESNAGPEGMPHHLNILMSNI